MANSPKPARKMVAFDQGSQDQLLLQAIEMELADGCYHSFSELCKVALHQFLVDREPTQSVSLFMELAKQIASIESRSEQLEIENSKFLKRLERLERLEEQTPKISQTVDSSSEKTQAEANQTSDIDQIAQLEKIDPLLARLTPLLESF